MALVICQWCRNKDEKSLMIKDTKGYYHNGKGCYKSLLDDKEFKRIEREKQTKLAEKIAEVYELENIQLIPSQFYPYLQDIRNDSKLFGKLGKSYKNGIPYDGIAYTYDYCKDAIREAHRTKEFKNFLMELRYGLAIVKNNLVDAKEHSIRQHKNKLLTDHSIKQVESRDMSLDTGVEYKKRKDMNDISNLL
ncbi:hypothetical protein NV379_01990 [Paenibacillus sp. N1-5-1-14]|uniref:hypothetical protein n=1 Tax=Paenibacillus radicibacter TaxID=2972488 RepID=UPI0021598565|nr:hypothetical protein [Paenibacillus radicibacter]MCR8641416.1 hypothetical protein [Paenibacillus radicibacter]